MALGMAPRKRDVMAHYDAWGGRVYDEVYRQEQSAKYEAILSRLRIDPDEIVLDLGCGTGLLLREIPALSVGVDISIPLLRRARRRIRGGHGLIRCDAEHLPFRGEIFHKILAVTVIQNISRPDVFLSEVRRVSRAGSEIVITVLKKFLNLEESIRLIESSGLSVTSSFSDEEVKDWIIFTSNPRASMAAERK
jgi:ubiquinone/menaquinone biosynthesis C-methylase UbiE